MPTDQPEDWRRREAERAVRITVGVEKVSQDWRSYLALVIAAPDDETLIRWTCERFRVDEEVAAVLLDQQLKTLIRRRRITAPGAGGPRSAREVRALSVRGSAHDDEGERRQLRAC